MNALRRQFASQLVTNTRAVVLQSMALSTITAVTTISASTTKSKTTFCAAGDNNDSSGDDILSKIKDAVNIPTDLNLDFDSIGTLLGSRAQEVIDSGIPTQISYGFLCGYSSGYALKKVGKAASVVFGLGFVTLQSLSYAGYLQINHGALKKDVERVLDLNQDGTVDDKDVNMAYEKVMEVLQFNMTGGSGFAAGFIGGMRSG
mmetsp:Transcript_3344/g.4863  ORF Transcript_3344/g.4863 Transcript_3344/m.4863 type:complete len:203 (+) Transcript_3344:91-699(+)